MNVDRIQIQETEEKVRTRQSTSENGLVRSFIITKGHPISEL
jgi:hypothetical protein